MNELIREGMRRAGEKLANEAHGITKGRIIPPRTRDELWHLVRKLWDVEIPRAQVCEGHCSPFTAFADAFFAKTEDGDPVPICVWHASRGLGGKSMMLAILALTEAAVLAAKVNLLGGSGEQSERVLKYMYGEEIAHKMWDAPQAPRHLIEGGIEKGALKKETVLTNGGYVRALMASSRSVRGPHPERLRLDEVDEMELSIFDSAMGQTMALRDIPAQTVCSSTWHNANGTMTEILKRAREKGWKIYRWCMHENHEDYGGWLPQAVIDQKKYETTSTMFDIEYELQEPSPESRAIDPAAVEAMFRKDIGEFEGKMDEKISLHVKIPGGTFGHGADWAKRKDYTVIITFQVIGDDPVYHSVKGEDPPPLRVRLVEFVRTARKPWPVMVGMMEDRIKRYKKGSLGSHAAHDETGIGDVIGDYINDDGEMLGIWLTGQLRYQVFNDYIQAIEHGYVESPFIRWMYDEHKFCSSDDLSGGGRTNHPPDSIVAGAIAYYILKNRPVKIRARATWGK